MGREGVHKDLYISSARSPYEPAIFTTMEHFTEYHVVSAANDYIILGVLHSDKKTSNLYVSNTNGNIFWLVLSNVEQQNKDANEFAVDCVSFNSIAGVILCNQVNATYISYSSGAEWSQIGKENIEKLEDDGKNVPASAKLRLQLSNQYTKAGWYMPNFKLLNDGKYGYAYTHGKLGDSFPTSPSDKGLHVYMTRDGGVKWEQMYKGRHIFQATDYGRQVLTRHTPKFTATNKLLYSGDFAKSFHTVEFTDIAIMIDGILTEPGAHTPLFTVFGHQNFQSGNQKTSDSWHIITVNATELVAGEEKCQNDDYTMKTFVTPDGNEKSLGMTRQFKHQILTARCKNDETKLNKTNALITTPEPNCQKSDYTCGYLYKLEEDDNSFSCKFDKITHQNDLQDNHLYWFDENTSRWPMKIPSDKCVKHSSKYDTSFETLNKEFLKGDGEFGIGYKLVEKKVVKNKIDMFDTYDLHGSDYLGDDQNRGVGEELTFQMTGKLYKKELAVYDWTIERLDEEQSKYIQTSAQKETERNELKFTCQKRGRYWERFLNLSFFIAIRSPELSSKLGRIIWIESISPPIESQSTSDHQPIPIPITSQIKKRPYSLTVFQSIAGLE